MNIEMFIEHAVYDRLNRVPCSTGRVCNTTLLRPLFTIFLFHATIVIEGEGIGSRSVRVPHRFVCLPDPLEKRRDSKSGPCVWIPLVLPRNHIRSYVVERYPYTWPWVRIPPFLERVEQTLKRCGNRTDLAPIPSPSITIVAWKRKFLKKVDGVV